MLRGKTLAWLPGSSPTRWKWLLGALGRFHEPSRAKYTCEAAHEGSEVLLSVSVATASSPTRKLDLRVSSRTWSLEASAVVEWRQPLQTIFFGLPLVWAARAYTPSSLYRITQTHTKAHCTISTWLTPEPSGQVTEPTVHYEKLIFIMMKKTTLKPFPEHNGSPKFCEYKFSFFLSL